MSHAGGSMNDAIRMQISAFVDGELPDNEAELLLRRMSQDIELRNEVAEYLAIGRLVRGELGLAGADRLHTRITAEIDEQEYPTEAEHIVATAKKSRAIRPLAGAAIAATVALVAIFALQQNTAIDQTPADAPVTLVNEVVPRIDAQEERNRQFFRNHAETSSELGANGMNSRVVTLRFSEELPEDDADVADEATDDLVEEAVTQP
jgi:negative regulator of sigma E activity